MECLYINLDTATDRRTSIENSFDKYRRGNWTLRRVIGVDAASIETAQISGILSSAQKACVLSHRKAVGESLGNDDHVMISEDDTIFGESTFKHIDAILAPKATPNWDILYMDVGVSSIAVMINLLILRRALLGTGRVEIRSLKNVEFHGANSYLINVDSKQKIYNLLKNENKFDLPYDLFLRRLINEQRLNCFFVYPFLTTLSELGDISTIPGDQNSNMGLCWSLFRRMVWVDADHNSLRSQLAYMENTLSEEAKAYGIIWSGMLQNSLFSKK